jgi:hypothetical protein
LASRAAVCMCASVNKTSSNMKRHACLELLGTLLA